MKKTKQQHPLAAVNSMPGPAIKANGQRKQSDSKQSALWIHATETSQWWQSMTTSSKPCLLGEGITAIQHACLERASRQYSMPAWRGHHGNTACLRATRLYSTTDQETRGDQSQPKKT
eukprot:scpid91422/ scgid2801/ 